MFKDFLRDLFILTPVQQQQFIITLSIIIIMVIVRYIILKIIWLQSNDLRFRYNAKKTVTYVIYALCFLLIGRVWFQGFQSLATFLGLLSAGIAIAMRDIIINPIAWVFILWRKPFQVGDRVQIGSIRGDVIDIRVFQFTLMEIGNWVDADQSTGRIIHIPNGRVFSDSIANYSRGFTYIWNEIGVVITFESNWKKAKAILMKIAMEQSEHLSKPAQRKVKEASKKFMIFYNTLTPTVYTSVKDHGVKLAVRYLCEPRERRGTEQAIWEKILTKFQSAKDIDFAYPTTRFYQNQLEGKAASTET